MEFKIGDKVKYKYEPCPGNGGISAKNGMIGIVTNANPREFEIRILSFPANWSLGIIAKVGDVHGVCISNVRKLNTDYTYADLLSKL